MEQEKKHKKAVGILIIALDTGNVLLLQRSNKAGHSHMWALLSGGIDAEENEMEALKREISEEIGVESLSYISDYEKKDSYSTETPTKILDFSYYIGFTNSEFEPKLNFENENSGWFGVDNLPSPLFKGLRGKINKLKPEIIEKMRDKLLATQPEPELQTESKIKDKWVKELRLLEKSI